MTDTVTYDIGPLVVLALLVVVGFIVSRRSSDDDKEVKPSPPGTNPIPPAVTGELITPAIRVIMRTDHKRFMSAAYHNNQFYGGTYNAGGPCHVVSESGTHQSFPAKESAYELKSRPPLLVTSFEKLSDIKDGATGRNLSSGHGYMVTSTEQFNEEWFSVSASQFGGDLYFKHHGHPRVVVARGKLFSRGLFYMGDTLYFGATNYEKGECGLFGTKDFKNFKWYPIFDNYRPMHADVQGDTVVIAASQYDFKNKRRIAAAAFRILPDLEIKQIYRSADHGGAFDVVTKGTGTVFLSVLDWNGSRPGGVVTNQGGKGFHYLAKVEGEGLGLALSPYNTLGLGASINGKGVFYEIGDVTKKPDIAASFPHALEIGSGFVWKPISEGDHKLVILFPSSFGNGDLFLFDGTKMEKGRFDGRTNGNRPTYRFSKQGKDYPEGAKLTKDGKTWVITNTATKQYG